MKTIRIEYTRLHFFRKAIEIRAPEKWEELSGRQFAICSRLFLEQVPDDVFISEYFGISKKLAGKFSKFEQYRLIECAGFISEPKAAVNYFYLKEIPDTYLCSPEIKLKSVSFEQFMILDTYFFDYVNGHDDDSLCRFVSSLYMKKGESIRDFDFEERMAYIAAKVDKATMFAIFLNYTFIRKWLSGVFRYLFEYREEDKEKQPKKNAKNKRAGSGRPDWNSILDGFMGDDILHEEEYRNLKCIRAFKTINNRIKNYKDGKRKPVR
ncbi:hypothetical protein [Dysgonomonas termitidis]|uniref:MarR family transcriptional regulator n=1 Tax=Dysgonomonas termitidis TaxID=1516126 RepID=A0ABV9L2K9_9BACT